MTVPAPLACPPALPLPFLATHAPPSPAPRRPQLPIAISALLVARARGICCFNRFEKLNKDEAAGAPGALSTVKEEDGASDTPSRQGQP